MAKISSEAELNYNYEYYLEKNQFYDFSSVDDAIAYNACKTSNLVDAKTILAFTESGSTAAGRASSFRPKAFIIGLIQGENIETLLLRWGVIPIHASKFKNVQDMFESGSKVSLETGLAKNDLVEGWRMPIGIPCNTNLMRENSAS